MIDPANITNYNPTDAELEEQILFWICAAGKNGTTAARCLEKFLNLTSYYDYKDVTPFNIIRLVLATKSPKPLAEIMKEAGIGCYNHKARTFHQLVHADIDLRSCAPEELEQIYGIGMKTSRCFILHTRKNAQVAGLDTHMLKHLKVMGVRKVPKTTPGSKKVYLRLEKKVLKFAKRMGFTPAEYDLAVWNKYSVKSTSGGK